MYGCLIRPKEEKVERVGKGRGRGNWKGEGGNTLREKEVEDGEKEGEEGGRREAATPPHVRIRQELVHEVRHRRLP